MIVPDSNLILYLFGDFGELSTLAREVASKEKVWRAPRLWRSEVTQGLLRLVRKGALSESGAHDIFLHAHGFLTPWEVHVSQIEALTLALRLNISAYDAEFVLAARSLKCPLVTFDRKLINADPRHIRPLSSF